LLLTYRTVPVSIDGTFGCQEFIGLLLYGQRVDNIVSNWAPAWSGI